MWNIMRRTAKLIRAWRRTNDVTQAELAEKLGIPEWRIESIESEQTNVNPELLILIRDVTGIDFEDMLSPLPETCIVLDENLCDTDDDLDLDDVMRTCDQMFVPHDLERKIEKIVTEQENHLLTKATATHVAITRLIERGLATITDESANDIAKRLSTEKPDDIVILLSARDGSKSDWDETSPNLLHMSFNQFEKSPWLLNPFCDTDSKAFFEAVREGNVRKTKLLLRRHTIDVNRTDEATGITPLHQAIGTDNVNAQEVLKLLLAHKDIDLNRCAKTSNGMPPLSYAIVIENHYAAELLIDAGANVNIPSSGQHDAHMTPLMTAAREGATEIVSLLIERGACVNQQDQGNGLTALAYATMHSHEDAVRLLLDAGADPTIRTWDGLTAQSYATTEPIRRMLNQNPNGWFDTDELLERLARMAERHNQMQSDADRWCAGCLPRTMKNPLKTFEEEYESSRTIVKGRLNPESRLGKMTNDQYNQYVNITKTLSEIWSGETELTRDQFVDAVMQRFGTFPLELKILISNGSTKEHKQLKTTTRDIQSKYAKNNRRLFAGGHLSPNELVQFDEHGRASNVVHAIHVLDEPICRIYRENKDAFARDRRHFSINTDGSLCDTGGEVFIDCENDDKCTVTDRFYIYLATLQSWNSLADGVLEDGLRQELTP